MSNPAPQLVQKLWNYCNILRDDGLSYGDYVEQLTLGSLAPARSGLRPFATQKPFRSLPSGSSLQKA
jgi:type I restriction enzyme M protein